MISTEMKRAESSIANKILRCRFPQPISEDGFEARLEERNVCVESVVFAGFDITGIIRVKNLGRDTSAKVKFTFNGWETWQEVKAAYCPMPFDESYDKFSFRIAVPRSLQIGEKIIFCVCYLADGEEFWDGYKDCMNYTIEVQEWNREIGEDLD